MRIYMQSYAEWSSPIRCIGLRTVDTVVGGTSMRDWGMMSSCLLGAYIELTLSAAQRLLRAAWRLSERPALQDLDLSRPGVVSRKMTRNSPEPTSEPSRRSTEV